MTYVQRPATLDDLPELSELCVRSKAHWGMDAASLEACREELTLRPDDLCDSLIMVVLNEQAPIAVAQLRIDGSEAEIWKFFVDPRAIGTGIGRQLWRWCVDTALAQGATHIRIEADPMAEAFYARMGAKTVGSVPSGSIPGRRLPLMRYDLCSSSFQKYLGEREG